VRTLFVATQPSGRGALQWRFPRSPLFKVRSNGVTDAADNATVVTCRSSPALARRARHSLAPPRQPPSQASQRLQSRHQHGGNRLPAALHRTNVAEATSSTFAITAPPVSQVTFAIDSSQDVRSISRFIYGMNGWDPAVRPANLALSRSGGNRMTAYNWETNDSNAGADFQNQNDTFLGGGAVPNGAVKPGLEAARAREPACSSRCR
jgi:hypothetical protein